MSARKIRNSWWVNLRFKGTRYRIRSPDNSRAGAAAYEAHLRGRLAEGKLLTDTKAQAPASTYADFAKEWFETYVRTNNKPSEQRKRLSTLRVHLVPFFGQMMLNDIPEIQIERYKARKRDAGLAPKSINNHLGILNKSLNSARDWGRVETLPRIRPLRVPPQRFDFLTPPESKRLLAAAQSQPLWYHMILCGLRTGLRFGELLGLDWSDIDFGTRQMVISRSVVCGHVGSPKNNRTRVIPLSEDLALALRRRAKPSGPVFEGSSGKMIVYNTALKALARITDSAGLRHIGWHTLRHTFASQLVGATVPIRAVQELLGHATLQMTTRYAHLSPSTLHAAVSVLPALHEGSVPVFGQPVGNAQPTATA